MNERESTSDASRRLNLVAGDSINNADSGLPIVRDSAQQKMIAQQLPELLELERLIVQHPQTLTARVEHMLSWRDWQLPLYSVTIGSRDPQAPAVLMTAGMHGVERIGSQVLIAWMQTLLERMKCDAHLCQLASQIQLVFMPILNPVGMWLNRRCNGNGIDLNRNAPIDAEDDVKLLGGGHRLGGFLPWYRGRKDAPMEPENLALERVIKRQVFGRPMALALDLHSGFGVQDRLWFPHAYRRKPIENIADYVALKMLWERTYPNHIYIFEPQSIHYLSHGDVWDYFHDIFNSRQTQQPQHFLSLTLEMGSWAWVKKRPRQLLNFAGLFNPQMKHRHARVLRRHILLLDFMLAATLNSKHWLPDDKQTGLLTQAANSLWFS